MYSGQYFSQGRFPPVYSQQVQQPSIAPTRIDPQFQFNPQNSPKVKCYYHPNNEITHFCKENQMPLCHECVAILQEESKQRGTPTDIVVFEQSLTEAFGGIASLANQILEDKDQVKQDVLKEQNDTDLTNALVVIQKAKEQSFELLTTYFDNLEKIAKEQFNAQKQAGLNEVKLFEDSVGTRWEEITKSLDQLNSKECLPTLIHYFQGDFNQEYQRYRQVLGSQAHILSQRLPKIQDFQSNIRYDQNSLSKLLADLHQFISLKGTHPLELTSSQATKPSTHNPYLQNSKVLPQTAGQPFALGHHHLPGSHHSHHGHGHHGHPYGGRGHPYRPYY